MLRWLIIAIACLGCTKRVTFKEDTPLTVLGPPRPATPIVREDAIVVRGKIEFDPQATIVPISYELLNAVAAVSKQHPGVKKIVVEANELSASQSKALFAYLVERGVAKDIAITYAPDVRQVLAAP